MSYIVVFVTASNKKEATKIARNILNKKLVACVNIIPGIDSTYWWKNKIESSKEVLLIAKTKKTLLNKVTSEIRRIHSYTVPEIIALPIIGGNRDYLSWISDSTKK